MNVLLKIALLLIIGLVTFGCTPKKKTSQDKVMDAKSCVEHVIAVDDSIGRLRNHNCEKISLSETIKIYVNGIESINFENCPEDFTKAFKDHKDAWKDMITLTDKFPDLRGEMHDLFKIIEKGEEKDIFKPLLDNIWATWADVEKSMKP